MTKEEYLNRIVIIRGMASEEMRKLANEYVKEDMKHKVGEIVSDGYTTIKITGVLIHTPSFNSNTPPMYSYKGIELTKKLEPKKSGAIGYVFPDRIK